MIGRSAVPKQSYIESINQMNTFISAWKGHPGLVGDVQLGQTIISTIVEYEAKRRSIKERTRVVIHRYAGPDDGKISLDERGKLVVEKYHLDFHPRWQAYSFIPADKSLRITGESDKMGGAYAVNLTPTSP